MKLVQLHEGQIVVSTIDIGKRFNKAHKSVLLAIRNCRCSEEFRQNNFIPATYPNRGKEYPCYLLTRDGFSFLVMGFTGEKADVWKEKYIKAFNLMEKKLLSQQDKLEWKLVRSQTKMVRKSLTDTIQKFVEYCKSQGSTKANYYYSNITKMEYKALNLLKLYSNDKNLRDQLDLLDLGFLITAENICQMSLEEGMRNNLPYKDIYTLAKERVIQYADVINQFRTVSLPST